MIIDRYLLDSDILIEHLRGRLQASTYITNLKSEGDLLVLAITVAELYAGARHEREKDAIDSLLHLVKIIPVDETIAIKGGLYRLQYGKSHGTGLMDALIAATAEQIEATLITFNQRHYPMLPNLIVPYQR